MKSMAPERRADFAAIRRDFPIFEQRVNGKPLAYLDNTATTQKPASVIEAVTRFYRMYNANIHRGIYKIAEEATEAYEEARRKTARLLNARSSSEIVFTRGTTESINLVAYSWGRTNVGPGDVIVATEMEHHSNLVPWQILAQERGATVRYIPVDGDGLLDLSGLDRLLLGPVRIVAVTHMSNVLGTINPIAEIARRAHAAGARILVDGAQSVPHMAVDVRALDCDFLAFSGHKMLAPTGIGALYAKRDLLNAMPPFMAGGHMIDQVKLSGSTWADPPGKFEAGTMHIAGAIGLGAAIDYLEAIGFEAIRAHSAELVAHAFAAVGPIPGVTIYGPRPEQHGPIVSFTLDDIHAHDVAAILDQEGVAVRAGHHCAMPLHEKLGVPATTRASFYVYNLTSDLDRLADGLRKAKQTFHR
jgi:cysteine desulfurase / selenocysteine lyase